MNIPEEKTTPFGFPLARIYQMDPFGFPLHARDEESYKKDIEEIEAVPAETDETEKVTGSDPT